MDAEAKRELESLAKRHPKRGIDLTIPPAIRAQMVEMEKDRERQRMGKRYDQIMPSPEPGEPKARGFSKGGVTRGDGCVSKGHTKGKVV